MWSSDIGNPFTYWILKILLLIVLAYCGWGISYKDDKYFRFYSCIATVFYSLIQGLRWMRGADYYHYYQDLVTNFNADISTVDPEPLYKLWCNLFYYSGLPYWCAFIFYSALLIVSFLLLLKRWPKAAVWALPLFFLMTSSSENIIRQYLAICFIIFSYYACLRNKKLLMYIFLICVPLIHISGLIPVVLFVVFNNIKNPFKTPFILIVIYLTFYFFWNNTYFSFISDLFSSLKLGDLKLAYYTDNAQRWFTEEGSASMVLSGKIHKASSFIYSFSNMLWHLIVIYYGFYLLKDDRNLLCVYYFTYIAILLKTIGGDIEMYIRFYNWFIYFTPLLIGIIIYKHPRMKKNEHTLVCLILFIVFIFHGFVLQIGKVSYTGCAFIWDR